MKKTYLVGALMIGGTMIFSPIKAQAAPTAGVTAKTQELLVEPPVAEWQKDILYAATVEDDKPKRKVKKIQNKKENNNADSNIQSKNEQTTASNRRHLTKQCGVFQGPSGRETYYNLSMERVIQYMEALGYSYRYWVREDGVKMYGQYVMCAADLSIRPKGTILETSLGKAIVCDTGGFTRTCPYGLDIATAW